LSKNKKGKDPGGKHRISVSVHHRAYKTKAKSKSYSKQRTKRREPTGKELVEGIMREIWSNIRRKERK